MFIPKEDFNNNLGEISLRERFLREINNLSHIENIDVQKDEILRKELLDKIKKGELEIPV